MASKKKTISKQKPKKTKVKKVKQTLELNNENIIYTNGTGKLDRGRSPAFLELDKVLELAKIGCTQSEIYAVLGISKKTFITMKKNNPILMETILAGKQSGNASLRRKQMQVAMGGNPQMLTWLGKNNLNQTDKTISHVQISQGETFKQALSGSNDSDEDDSMDFLENEL